VKTNLIRNGSLKADQFTESVIREMTRLAIKLKAVNLGQGIPDFPAPNILKHKATEAIFADLNQYAITWGDPLLRTALANKYQRDYQLKVNPETDITVVCGATEGMVVAMLALVDPGEEVIVFEPFYENYGPDAILSGATPKYVRLHEPDWRFDIKELEKAFNDRTRAIIINTPHNPTGVVFGNEELSAIAQLCQKWGVIAITDEIYEHILYDGRKHACMGALPGMEELTVTVNSLSKTFSITGWRVGWVIANAAMTSSIRKVHDFLTVGAPAPLQRASVTAINLGEEYYRELAEEYEERREHLLATLTQAGIPFFNPEGAYYVFSNISKFGFPNDVAFTKHLVENVGVAVVPGSSFYGDREAGKNHIRFCFSRRMDTLVEARSRLLKGQLTL
jgi:aspartate/methionine/tyrosine aminotransferase